MLLPTTVTTVIVLIVVLFPERLTTDAFSIRQTVPHRQDHYLGSRTDPSQVEEEDERGYLHQANLHQPSQRHKRLMGIFRCNGWGPGCTKLDSASAGGGGGGGGGRGGGEGPSYRGGESTLNRSPIQRFQPFFTLTSGGSWGPTGKRSQTPDEPPHPSKGLLDSERTKEWRNNELTRAEYMDNVRSRENLLLKVIERLLLNQGRKTR